MAIEFVKYQAAGNDYIYIDCRNRKKFNYSELAKKLSDRHFGIGGDGVVFILESDVADCKMRMFNADGSEGQMCGNAVRSVAKYMRDYTKMNGESIKIETASGIKIIECLENKFTANMGKVSFFDHNFRTKSNDTKAEIEIDGKLFFPYLVSVGNPHAVIFEKVGDFYKIGASIENSRLFKGGINVEFVEAINDYLEVKVWERGSGRTLACGTGACAVAFSAIQEGSGKRNEWQKIKMEGGFLEVLINSNDVAFLRGEVVEVFRGEFESYEYEDEI